MNLLEKLFSETPLWKWFFFVFILLLLFGLVFYAYVILPSKIVPITTPTADMIQYCKNNYQNFGCDNLLYCDLLCEKDFNPVPCHAVFSNQILGKCLEEKNE